MGWGGGGGFGGPMGGGGFGGPGSNGLPFGGIPSELQAGVDKLVATEPDHEAPGDQFRQLGTKGKRHLSLWALLAAQPRRLVAAALLVVVISVTSQAGPKLVEIAINQGMAPHRGNFGVVAAMAALYLATLLVAAVAHRSQVRVTGRLAAEVNRDLRVRVFTHLQRLSLDFFTTEKAGVVMTRMTSDIENLQQLLQDGLSQLAIQALTMAVIVVVLFTLNVELALITIALVLPLLIVASLWFRRASERGYARVRNGIAGVLADLSESLHGVRVVAAYNRQRHNLVHHRNVLGSYRDAYNHTAQINAIYGPGTQLLGVLGQGALLAIGGLMVVHGQLSVGALVAFFLYLNRFFQPIQLLVQQYSVYQQGQASIPKLRGLLETTPSVAEQVDAAELGEIAGEIVFEHVAFGYGSGDLVLRDVDLRIAPGETVAFVGPTGAGKSTLAKLVTRFYDPTEGRILIDGHDLRTVTLQSLRRQLGVVPQEPFLFAGSIRDNVAFARPDAREDEVARAVASVGLNDLLSRLPGGIDTVLSERGTSLSAGERQLIALARAFLARPRVLVLDEATSNLDLQSETVIEGALDVVLQGRTAVLIAHRLSTAMRADRIVVVRDGGIAEVGTHEELLRRDGHYADMYATWSRQSRYGETVGRS